MEQTEWDDHEVGQGEGEDNVADHCDHWRENPQSRSIEAHAADVNRKEDRQKCADPAAIGSDAVDFVLLEPGAGLGKTLRMFDADVGNDALIRIVLGVDGRCRQIDRRRGQPQAGGQRDHPVRCASGDQQDRADNRQVPGCRASGLPNGLSGRGLTDDHARVSQGVERERHGHKDREGGRCEPGGVEQEDAEDQRVRTARPGAALCGGSSAPESLDDLRSCAGEEREAGHPLRLRRPER